MKNECPVLLNAFQKQENMTKKIINKSSALISTQLFKQTAAQGVKIFLLQEEKGWALTMGSFTDPFYQGPKRMGLRVGGNP